MRVGAIAANGGAAAGHVLATSSSSHVSICFLSIGVASVRIRV